MITTTFRAWLPYPPSVNAIWKSRVITPKGKRPFVSTYTTTAGKKFRDEVIGRVEMPDTLEGRVAIKLLVYPPDNRKRDIDNTVKAVLDALQFAQVYKDDSQIDHLSVERMEVTKPGSIMAYFAQYETSEDLYQWTRTQHKPTITAPM